ncbi:hypothetical protein NHG52_13565 [Bacillus thuringiensis]|uniref:hypothetical protein n=1 Tax=Bacillus cereus group sp. BfR-BA-01345 TaxID=2920308 RepID=UPI001F58BA04|nr:hypothetical protein [Bacillus thuringiensis]MEB8985558.1 hypothetical protein [Bacillus cereus]UQM91590.1 hypothetical protein SY271_000789 [Bacillus thuringiensis]UQM92739.1 hypothetical protein SY621A_000094 [Bacillus thuringiensis]
MSDKKELNEMYTLADKILEKIKSQNNNKPLKETHFHYLSRAIEYWKIQNEE